MTNSIQELLKKYESGKFATGAGTQAHLRLMQVCIDGDATRGDAGLVQKIKSCDGLPDFFGPTSRTEVPIAGFIDGKFISRRIDRMIVNHELKTVRILDYKTDVNPDAVRSKYAAQVREYCALMQRIYPDYKITGHILWLHDWCIESV